MITSDTLLKIRRIELRTRKLVNDSFAGSYHAIFKGRGIEFDAVRPYEPGDDIRSIDWNVTARAGEPFIKRFVEERELTVMLVIDTSASSFFGTVNQQKHDLAAEFGAVLAYAAISNQDRVGLLLFSDEIELYVPPRKGRNHVLLLIRDLLAAQPAQKGTNISLALKTLNRVLKSRAIVFLVSDFLAAQDEYAADLAITARYHDLIGVVLSDPLESVWPDVGLLGLQDAETETVRWIDTAQKNWTRKFDKQAQRFQQMRDEMLYKVGIDRIDLPSDGDYLEALTTFFRRRMQRLAK
ncbi:MAG: DUF58 domain-containing protein [Chloroflexota bacterium]